MLADGDDADPTQQRPLASSSSSSSPLPSPRAYVSSSSSVSSSSLGRVVCATTVGLSDGDGELRLPVLAEADVEYLNLAANLKVPSPSIRRLRGNGAEATPLSSSDPISSPGGEAETALGKRQVSFLRVSKTGLVARSGITGSGLRLAQVKGELVSVRSLLVDSAVLGSKKDILQKLIATQINHENVLSLKGIYVQDQEQNLEHLKLLAVNEHMEGLIDADSLLRSDQDLSLFVRLQMACACIEGLASLHKKGIVHGDLHLGRLFANVQREIFKIAEFGVTRLMEREPDAFHASPEVNSAFLTQDLHCPEETKQKETNESSCDSFALVLAQDRAHTAASRDGCSCESDIYSFGIILLQLLFGRRIADVEQQRNKGKLNEAAFRIAHQDESYDPPQELRDVRLIDEGTSAGKQELLSLALNCLQKDPAQRPTLEILSKRLRSAIVRTLLVDPNVQSIWMDALQIEERRIAGRKSIILGRAEKEGRIISSAINLTLNLNIPNLGKLRSPNAASRAIEPPPLSQASTNLLPFQLDWQSLYEAFFIIHLQQPAVRDDEWPSGDKGMSKAKRNRLPHILALLLIHELIAKWDRLEALKMSSRERKNRLQSTRKLGPLEDASGLLLMKPELKGSVSMKQWLRFSQWFPIGQPADTRVLKNVCDIIGHKYFQPIQSSKEAEVLLSENSTFGTFLFRFSSHPGDYAVSWIAQVEKEGKITRVHLTHDRFTRTEDNKFKYHNKIYDDLEAVYKALKHEKGLQEPYKPKYNGLEYLKIALEKRIEEQPALIKPEDSQAGDPSMRGRAMTRVISEQFEGEDIPKNIRKMLAKDDAWVGLGSGYEPLFLLNSKEGKLLVREGRKRSAHRERYVSVSNGFLVIYTDESKEQTLKVITLEGLEVMKHNKDGKIVRLVCEAEGTWIELMAQDFRESEQWAAALRRWTLVQKDDSMTSYAPERHNITCRWFVDGNDYFLAAYRTIKAATSSIFITDWWLMGEIFLKKNPFKTKPHHRLDMLLKRKAEEDVEIFIILWKEAVMKLGSYSTKHRLQGLHPNIYVMRHPNWKKFPGHTYSHHQKTLVVDYGTKHMEAFVGGIDLCFGRWDDKHHAVVDDNRIHSLHPGKDYINPEIEGSVTNEEPFMDVLDRDTVPRMPWHDIQCQLDGEAAMDVGHNFIQRWNAHRRALKQKHRREYPILTPAPNPFDVEKDKDSKKNRSLNFTNFKETWEKRKEEKEEKHRQREKERHERKERDKEKQRERDEEKRKKKEDKSLMERKGSYLLLKLKERIEDDPEEKSRKKELKRKKREERLRKQQTKDNDGDEKVKQDINDVKISKKDKKHKKDKKPKTTPRNEQGTSGDIDSRESQQISGPEGVSSIPVGSNDNNYHSVSVSSEDKISQEGGDNEASTAAHTNISSDYAPIAEPGGREEDEKDARKRNKLRDFLHKEKQQMKGAFMDMFEQTGKEDTRKKAGSHIHHGDGSWHGPPQNSECPQASSEVSCSCQLLRSISEWSGGNRLEKSIQAEYINIINNAQHFIYIENQYFISGLSNSGPVNKIAEALSNRIIRAIREQQPFKVVVVLPVLPDPGPQTWPGRAVTRLHAETIWNSKTSLLSTLAQNGVSKEAATEYVSFHGLRNWGKTMTGNYLTHQIYVHSKLIIVDDRVAIIGSANINDRSMNGNKDSEIAVKIVDTELKNGLMNGRTVQVGKFCHSLRVTLWKEHLGFKAKFKDKEQERDMIRTVCDPVVGYEYWRALSKQNSVIYAKIFPWTPHDAIGTLDEWKDKVKEWERQKEEHSRKQWKLAREMRLQKKQREMDKQAREKDARMRDKHLAGGRNTVVKSGNRVHSSESFEEANDEEVTTSDLETELMGIVGHVVDYSFHFLQGESISLSEHITLTAVGTLPVTADMFY